MAGKFTLSLNKFKAVTAEQHKELVQKVGLELLRRVVLKSPVDTGRFRGNHQVTIGTPAAGSLDSVDLGGGQTISKGAAVLAKVPNYPTVWIANNLSYAMDLEFGRSKQAPEGVYRVSVAELGALFK